MEYHEVLWKRRVNEKWWGIEVMQQWKGRGGPTLEESTQELLKLLALLSMMLLQLTVVGDLLLGGYTDVFIASMAFFIGLSLFQLSIYLSFGTSTSREREIAFPFLWPIHGWHHDDEVPTHAHISFPLFFLFFSLSSFVFVFSPFVFLPLYVYTFVAPARTLGVTCGFSCVKIYVYICIILLL